MKRSLILILSAIICALGVQAQNGIVTGKEVQARQSLTLNGRKVTGISNDTNRALRRTTHLVTEWAMKNYADSGYFPFKLGYLLVPMGDTGVRVDSAELAGLLGGGGVTPTLLQVTTAGDTTTKGMVFRNNNKTRVRVRPWEDEVFTVAASNGIDSITVDGYRIISRAYSPFSHNTILNLSPYHAGLSRSYLKVPFTQYDTEGSTERVLAISVNGNYADVNGNISVATGGNQWSGTGDIHNTDTTGKVGIGTTTPIAPLHVVGDGTNTAAFMNGNVGIGTIPNAKLHVNGSGPNYVYFDSLAEFRVNAAQVIFNDWNTGNDYAYFGPLGYSYIQGTFGSTNGNILETGTGGEFYLRSLNAAQDQYTTRFQLSSGEDSVQAKFTDVKVGINTDNADYPLEVKGMIGTDSLAADRVLAKEIRCDSMWLGDGWIYSRKFELDSTLLSSLGSQISLFDLPEDTTVYLEIISASASLVPGSLPYSGSNFSMASAAGDANYGVFSEPFEWNSSVRYAQKMNMENQGKIVRSGSTDTVFLYGETNASGGNGVLTIHITYKLNHF